MTDKEAKYRAEFAELGEDKVRAMLARGVHSLWALERRNFAQSWLQLLDAERDRERTRVSKSLEQATWVQARYTRWAAWAAWVALPMSLVNLLFPQVAAFVRASLGLSP